MQVLFEDPTRPHSVPNSVNFQPNQIGPHFTKRHRPSQKLQQSLNQQVDLAILSPPSTVYLITSALVLAITLYHRILPVQLPVQIKYNFAQMFFSSELAEAAWDKPAPCFPPAYFPPTTGT